VINPDDASLEDAVVLMKLTLLEIERPVSREVGALLRSARNAVGLESLASTPLTPVSDD